MRWVMLLVFAGLALTACGEKKDVKETVFAPAVGAKDKARAVEEKLKQSEEKNREALKASDADGGEAPKIQGY